MRGAWRSATYHLHATAGAIKDEPARVKSWFGRKRGSAKARTKGSPAGRVYAGAPCCCMACLCCACALCARCTAAGAFSLGARPQAKKAAAAMEAEAAEERARVAEAVAVATAAAKFLKQIETSSSVRQLCDAMRCQAMRYDAMRCNEWSSTGARGALGAASEARQLPLARPHAAQALGGVVAVRC